MVGFRWGQNPKLFPDSYGFIKDKMLDFIKDGDISFIVNLKRAIKSVRGTPDESKLREEFIKLSKEVMEMPLEPLLKVEADGWNRFTSLPKGEKNTKNIEFIKDKKISDVTNSDVLSRLRGFGAAQYIKQGKLEVPEFDFREWWIDKREPLVSRKSVPHDLTFRSSEAEDKEGVFNFSHKKELSNTAAHFEASFPPIDSDELISVKAEHILEKTGQRPKPKMSSSKVNLITEIIDYSFIIPPQTKKSLMQSSKVILQRQKTERDIGYVEGEYSPKGDFFEISPDDKSTPVQYTQYLTGISDLNRTSDMKASNIIMVNDVPYKVTATDPNAKKNIRVEFAIDDQKTPYTFIEDKQEQFFKILKPYLNSPTTVYTARILGNIKTRETEKPLFADKAKKEQASGAKASPSYYQGKKKLSESEIQDISDKAFKHKTETVKNEEGEDEPVRISERKYNTLSSEEKRDYVPDARIYEYGESGRLKVTEMTDFGGSRYSSEEVTADNVEKVFKETYVETTIVLEKHAELPLSPFRTKAANRPMSTHVNKIKGNIRNLKGTLGE